MLATVSPESLPTLPESVNQVPITVAYGDGIGPEIMAATLRILDQAGARIQPEVIELGERVYTAGISSGIREEAWESLRRTKVLLKAPITTPQGGGFKSLNVTIRKSLGLFANIRPCVSYAPIQSANSPKVDLVVVRENEEDLYAGIEHRQTDEVFQCLKLVSRPGCERIVRYAFEYARAHGRRKVTCMTKDNIMKLTDGLFHRVFGEIGKEYPEIEQEHMIIDIGMARVATSPGDFDVIVTPNLYGDILSDVTAETAGSVGLAPSANIGSYCAMFEAIHGSAPTLPRNVANPSGLLLAAVMMLVHIGQSEVAERVHNAWLKCIEDGMHTADIFDPARSKSLLSTEAFTNAVIERLGMKPVSLPPVAYDAQPDFTKAMAQPVRREPEVKVLVGVDVFVHWRGTADDLATQINVGGPDFELQMITNRGVKVWPKGMPETFCTDHWRCRFMSGSVPTTHQAIIALQQRLAERGVDFIKTEHLCTFDGQPGYSLGQGQ